MLSGIGVTEQRVEDWLGRPCGCAERREKLDALGELAARWARGKVSDAAEFFRRLTSADGPGPL